MLLTQSDAEALRRKLHAELSPAEERRLIILHGQRDSREELEKIHIHRANRVFVLSDDGELEHDSVASTRWFRFRRFSAQRTAAIRCPATCRSNTRVRSRSSNWPISKRPSG